LGTDPRIRKGAVLHHSKDFLHAFPAADSMTDYFAKYATQLELGNYAVSKKEEIILFPTKIGVSQATTRGVCITCSPLFIPERSSVSIPSYFFAYKITMTMGDHMAKADTCTLTTRHWYIKNANGRIEEASGPGVIGKFPRMVPGTHFEYQSCCPIPTLTGSMKGTFQMETLTGSSFDAEVPEFLFYSPAPIG